MRATCLAIGLLSLATVACSKSEPQAPVEPEPTVGEEAPPEEEEEVSIDGVAWADMNESQKHKYMEEVVMPTMKDLFVAHDQEEFAEFGCSTCHGKNAEEVGFEMPNGLHPLDPNHFPTPASPNAKVAAWASFMFNEVTPKMVELLGAEPYDMESGTGFGCYGCHEKVQ